VLASTGTEALAADPIGPGAIARIDDCRYLMIWSLLRAIRLVGALHRPRALIGLLATASTMPAFVE
jgi:hypothetical protein